MSAREMLEKIVNVFIGLAFATIAVGISIWFLDLAGRLNLSLPAILVVGGGIAMIFALLAAKLISRMES
jgi:hypothetical protein